MDKRMMDMYDIVALILTLAVCMPLGVVTTVRDYHEVKNYEANYEDKTAGSSYLPLKTDYGDYDGKIDKPTAVLTSQIQEYSMMDQGSIIYKDGNNSYQEDITTDYEDNASGIANDVSSALTGNGKEGGYRFKYDAEKNVYILQYESNRKKGS